MPTPATLGRRPPARCAPTPARMPTRRQVRVCVCGLRGQARAIARQACGDAWRARSRRAGRRGEERAANQPRKNADSGTAGAVRPSLCVSRRLTACTHITLTHSCPSQPPCSSARCRPRLHPPPPPPRASPVGGVGAAVLAAAAALAAVAVATGRQRSQQLIPVLQNGPPPLAPPPSLDATTREGLLELAAASAAAARQLAAQGGAETRVAELTATADAARAALRELERKATAAARAPPSTPPRSLDALVAAAQAALSPDAAAAEARLLGAAAAAEERLLALEAGAATPADVDAAAAELAAADGALHDLLVAALPPDARATLEAAAVDAVAGAVDAACLFGPARAPLQARARAAALRAKAAQVAAALTAEGARPDASAPRLAHLRRLRDTLEAALWRADAAAAPPTLPRVKTDEAAAAASIAAGQVAAAIASVAEPEAPATPPPATPPRARSHPPGTLRLVAGAAAIPHPAKADTGGEDAHFVLATGLGCAGVADGVGGWAAEGVDPALFSRALMAGAAASLQTAAASDTEACVRTALEAGHAATAGVPGSSTAVVAAPRPGGAISVAVLGDSGFRLLRGGRLALASDPQQHAWNTPFQLGAPGSQGGDEPSAADVYDIEAAPGDILILATDGVLDNLWPAEIEGAVAASLPPADRSPNAAAAVATALVEAAATNGADQTYKSPWIMEAAAAGVLPFWMALRPRGGKQDDCTAVVAFVEEA